MTKCLTRVQCVQGNAVQNTAVYLEMDEVPLQMPIAITRRSSFDHYSVKMKRHRIYIV
jgi:hypothetical protein